jgi:uncharacterized protein (DUF433 family)
MGTNGFHFIGVGVYAVPEASRITRVSPWRIRRWLQGYRFRVTEGHHESPPVFTSSLPLVDGELALNFWDLQEMRFVDAFLRAGVKWKTLRTAHERAEQDLGLHPFSRGNFVTDGTRIFQEIVPEVRRSDGAFVDIVSSQASFRSVVGPYIVDLSFDQDGQAAEWWPLGKDRLVVLNPQRSFGQPIVEREGVPTNILARAYRAEQSYARVARWYDVSESGVRDAVEYERTLTAA